MSDNQSDNTPAPPAAPDIEREALAMGWVPKDKFRGDPALWSDAETFVKKGREFLPIIKARNRDLEAKLQTTTGEVGTLKAQLAEAMDAIEALKEYQTEATREAVKKAKEDLRATIKSARDDGDVDKELEAHEALQRLTAAAKEADPQEGKKDKEEKKPTAAPTPPAANPAFEAWREANSWYGVDEDRTVLADSVARRLRMDPRNDNLRDGPFYDKVSDEVDRILGPQKRGKVDAGRSGTGGDGTPKNTGTRGYEDMPDEAKKACDKMASRLVGKAKAFKDEAAWRAHYAKEFFAGEEA